MKPSITTLEAISDIDRVETTGHVRRIGAQMLVALVRKEISATDVEAGAKMISAISMSIHTEVKLHQVAHEMRKSGSEIAKAAHIGQTLIGNDHAAH